MNPRARMFIAEVPLDHDRPPRRRVDFRMAVVWIVPVVVCIACWVALGLWAAGVL